MSTSITTRCVTKGSIARNVLPCPGVAVVQVGSLHPVGQNYRVIA